MESTAPARVKFTFAPGDKQVYEETLSLTREKDLGALGRQVDESLFTSRVHVTRTSAGWDLTGKPVNLLMKRDGQEVSDPLSKLLSRVVLTYKLQADGSILEVRGYEEFLLGLSKQLAPQVMAQLAPVLNIEAMKNKTFAEWDARIGGMIGKEITIGDTETTRSDFILPDRTTITFNVQTRYAAMVPCGDSRCVRIEQTYDSKADNAAKLATDVAANVIKMVAEPTDEKQAEPAAESAPALTPSPAEHETSAADSSAAETSPAPPSPTDATAADKAVAPAAPTLADDQSTIQGKVVRLIDPATMLIYHEEDSRIISMNLEVPGKGMVPGRLTETRVYQYKYGDLEPLISAEDEKAAPAATPKRPAREKPLAPGSMLD